MRLIDADELKGKAFADPDDGEHFVYCQDIDEAPTVDAVPVSELLNLRDELYEKYQITMCGLEKLNQLIAVYSSQRKEKPKDEKKLTTISPPRTCCVSWPKSIEECVENMDEEIADASLLVDLLGYNKREHLLSQGRVAQRKAERWLKRLEEAEGGGTNAQATQNLP